MFSMQTLSARNSPPVPTLEEPSLRTTLPPSHPEAKHRARLRLIILRGAVSIG